VDKYNQKWVACVGAITLGQTAYYSVPEDAVTDSWRKHEDCHKLQFKRYGVVGFLYRYVSSYLSYRLKGYSHWDAYTMIPLEREASDVAKD